MEILDLISLVYLASFVVMLPNHIAEVFHNLQLILIFRNLYWGWLPWDFHYLRFYHICYAASNAKCLRMVWGSLLPTSSEPSLTLKKKEMSVTVYQSRRRHTPKRLDTSVAPLCEPQTSYHYLGILNQKILDLVLQNKF